MPPLRKYEKPEIVEDNKPSDIVVDDRNIAIRDYINEEGGEIPLFVILEGEVCQLGISSISGDIVMQRGNDSLLPDGRRAVLTQASAVLFRNYTFQKELAQAEPPGAEDYVGEFRERLDATRPLSNFPEVKRAIFELSEALEKRSYDSHGIVDDRSAYRMLYSRKEAGQVLVKILQFLESQKFEVRMIDGKKTPNKGVFADDQGKLKVLILEIADTIGCRSTLERYLGEDNNFYLLLLYSNGSGRNDQLDRIDSAFICKN